MVLIRSRQPSLARRRNWVRRLSRSRVGIRRSRQPSLSSVRRRRTMKSQLTGAEQTESDLEAAENEVIEAQSSYEKSKSEHLGLEETLKIQQVSPSP